MTGCSVIGYCPPTYPIARHTTEIPIEVLAQAIGPVFRRHILHGDHAAGRDLTQPLVDREAVGNVVEPQIFGQRPKVEPCAPVGVRKEALGLGAEEERLADPTRP